MLMWLTGFVTVGDGSTTTGTILVVLYYSDLMCTSAQFLSNKLGMIQAAKNQRV